MQIRNVIIFVAFIMATELFLPSDAAQHRVTKDGSKYQRRANLFFDTYRSSKSSKSRRGHKGGRNSYTYNDRNPFSNLFQDKGRHHGPRHRSAGVRLSVASVSVVLVSFAATFLTWA